MKVKASDFHGVGVGMRQKVYFTKNSASENGSVHDCVSSFSAGRTGDTPPGTSPAGHYATS